MIGRGVRIRDQHRRTGGRGDLEIEPPDLATTKSLAASASPNRSMYPRRS